MSNPRTTAMLETMGLRCSCSEKPIALCHELEKELEAMIASIGVLREEIESYQEISSRQSDILSRSAVALRGKEPPLTKRSHHDIAERAAAAIANAKASEMMLKQVREERDALKTELEKLQVTAHLIP